MNKVTEVLKALNEPAIKLIEAISKGLGTLYEPHKVKKIADAEAYKIDKISKSLIESSYIPSLYKDSELIMSTQDFKDLQERSASRYVYQETKRQINIENIADKAYDLLSVASEKVSGQVNDDWIMRFISSAQDVSDDDIQNIWAKILSDEIMMPNTHSYRLLDALRNMTKTDILLFNKIASYVISESFIPADDDYCINNNITFEDIFSLQECRLISPASDIYLEINIDANDERVIHNDTYVMIANKTKNDIQIKILSHCLSKTGMELYKILKIPNNNDSFISFARSIKSRYKNMSFYLNKIIKWDGDNIFHDAVDYFNK